MKRILVIILFLLIPISLEAYSKTFYECNDPKIKNFEITKSNPIKVKFFGNEIIGKASKHNTGQKTYEWGTVYLKQKVQIRYFYIIEENRLVVFQIDLTDKELDTIIKQSKADNTGVALEKTKAEIFYAKYKMNDKIKRLGESKCKEK